MRTNEKHCNRVIEQDRMDRLERQLAELQDMIGRRPVKGHSCGVSGCKGPDMIGCARPRILGN